MQGIHTFKQERTSQVIKCNPWSTCLCLYLSLVRKMKTYLELEGRLGQNPRPLSQTQWTQNHPQQTQSWPVQPSMNPRGRKALTPKASDKRKWTMIAKRGYKVRVLNQPIPTITAPTTATTSTQMQTTGFAATAIPVTMHKLATGQFAEASSPTARSMNGGHPSVQNPPPLEDIPKASDRQGTPWPNVESTSENLFWNLKGLANASCSSSNICSYHEDRSTTLGSSNPQHDGHPQTSCKELHMGNELPHLQ